MPGSVSEGVYDFLYVDRDRVSALYSQLFSQGTLKTVTTSAQQSSSDDSEIGTDVKLFKAGTTISESATEGIQHVFDASWAIPLDVLDGLNQRSLIRFDLKNPRLGDIILLEGYVRIVDYASMKDLLHPAAAFNLGDTPELRAVKSVIEALPGVMHAHFLTGQGYLWSSLSPGNLTVPSSDIALKYGASPSGPWRLLFVVDAYPDTGEMPDLQGWSAGEATDGILQMMHALKTTIGRPSFWFGVTPLMIYGEILPASSQEILPIVSSTPVT